MVDAAGLQKLRANADQDIASSVGDINSDLQQISDLNKQIKQEAAAGQSTADLEDQRNSALQDLASMMNVSYFTASNGDGSFAGGSKDCSLPYCSCSASRLMVGFLRDQSITR